MPVKKTKPVSRPTIKPIVEPKKIITSPKGCGCCGDFGKKVIITLVAILLVYLVFYLGTLINNNLKTNQYIGQADKNAKTIVVNGYGKVTGSNDIAVTTVGYSNVAKDVSVAQSANNKVMNDVMKDLKALEILEKDLTSNYTIYPEYNYSSTGTREFSGYRVSNQVTVKIRDLTKIQNVLALAGKYGANQVSGLSFTIDDTDNLKSQARLKALSDARKKAQVISQSLGLKLVSVYSYNEYEGGSQPVYSSLSSGLGGAGGAGEAKVASGSNIVETNITVTYEVR